jgi:pullulanase
LKSLGVNAVHILPSYDYGSVDETRLSDNKYNWGYDPVNYNVPEGGYSTNPYDPYCRIREFKEMVNALHEAGIAVILDVVFNHTYDIEHSNFQRTYPDYYYRKTADGQYSNGSGCGNETASDQPMMRQFMIESVKYWYNEYRVDGFRFDLMGCHDIETMNAIRAELNKLDPSILVYGEGWSAGACALPNEKLGMKANIPQMPGIAAFSDEMRDALRGPFSDDTVSGWLGRLNTHKPGQFAGDVEVESLKFGIVGGIQHPQVNMKKVNYSQKPWALEPTQMLAYVSCHDDMCLVDRLKASIPKLKEDELIRLDLLAQTAVFTSQGVPFMLSGEELLRTKQGVHNSFESPDSINRLDWSNKERYPQVFKYYSDLITLRRNHPAFRLGDANLVRKHLEFLEAPDGVVAFQLKNYAGRDDWRNIIVILNPSRKTATVNIPKGMYTVVCKDGEINEDSTEKIFGRRTTVSPQSALILHD